MPKSNLRYLVPSKEVLSAYGVTVTINPDGTVDVVGAKEMRFESEKMNFNADNIEIHAKEKLVLKGDDSIHLNPHKKTETTDDYEKSDCGCGTCRCGS
jgi:aspartyl-tRNA synthetase